MWIRTQNKQVTANSDQITNIFIDKTGKTIYAITNRKDELLKLGEYQDRDTCLKVLDSIHMIIGSKVVNVTMPLGGEVDEWSKNITNTVTAYIVNDFRAR